MSGGLFEICQHHSQHHEHLDFKNIARLKSLLIFLTAKNKEQVISTLLKCPCRPERKDKANEYKLEFDLTTAASNLE